jgi:hypothetical protein
VECDRAGETSVKEIEQKATERSCKAQTHRRVPHRRNGDGPSSRPSVPEAPSHRAVHASTPTRVASGPGAPSGFRPTLSRQTDRLPDKRDLPRAGATLTAVKVAGTGRHEARCQRLPKSRVGAGVHLPRGLRCRRRLPRVVWAPPKQNRIVGRASGDRTCRRVGGKKLARAPSVCVCGGGCQVVVPPTTPGGSAFCRLAPSRYRR